MDPYKSRYIYPLFHISPGTRKSGNQSALTFSIPNLPWRERSRCKYQSHRPWCPCNQIRELDLTGLVEWYKNHFYTHWRMSFTCKLFFTGYALLVHHCYASVHFNSMLALPVLSLQPLKPSQALNHFSRQTQPTQAECLQLTLFKFTLVAYHDTSNSYANYVGIASSAILNPCMCWAKKFRGQSWDL